jgi:Sulfotransferase family
MPEDLPGYGVLFIIGTGRCGSTIVQEMLTRHPDVAFVSNVDELLSRFDLKGTWNNLAYRRIPQRFTQRDRVVPTLVQTRLHFGPSEAYRLIERRVSHTVSEPFRDLTERDVTPALERRFRRFVDARVGAQRRPLFLHKFTGWPRARFLQEIFPEARFVHVVRDGRAVASSLLQRPWWRGHLGVPDWGFGPLPDDYSKEWEESGRSLVALAGLEWKVLIDAADEARAQVPEDRWMDVRYEDFVEEPRGHVERILDWVGLPWTREFERSFSRYSYGRHRKAAYVRDLHPSQVELLDRLLEDHLRTLGYQVPSPMVDAVGD